MISYFYCFTFFFWTSNNKCLLLLFCYSEIRQVCSQYGAGRKCLFLYFPSKSIQCDHNLEILVYLDEKMELKMRLKVLNFDSVFKTI